MFSQISRIHNLIKKNEKKVCLQYSLFGVFQTHVNYFELPVSQVKKSKQMTYCVLLGASHFPVASINIFFVFPIFRCKINIIQGYGLLIL